MGKANVDSALVISITKNIRSAAKEYVVKKQLPISKTYYLNFHKFSFDSVKDGKHARG